MISSLPKIQEHLHISNALLLPFIKNIKREQNVTNFHKNLLSFQEAPFFYNFTFINQGFLALLQKYHPQTHLFTRQQILPHYFFLYQIDVPTQLKSFTPQHKISFNHELKKLLNTLMLQGQKEKNNKIISKIFLLFSKKYLNQKQVLNQHFFNVAWKNYCEPNTLPNSNPFSILSKLNQTNQWEEKMLTNQKSQNLIWRPNLFDFILTNFLTNKQPIFTFYVQKTDKNILKYSRGRSGKYSLIWRYVPLHKRLGVLAQWFKKDVKLQKTTSYYKRVFKVLEFLFLTPTLSLVTKLRTFVHKFVFQKYRKQILRSINVKS